MIDSHHQHVSNVSWRCSFSFHSKREVLRLIEVAYSEYLSMLDRLEKYRTATNFEPDSLQLKFLCGFSPPSMQSKLSFLSKVLEVMPTFCNGCVWTSFPPSQNILKVKNRKVDSIQYICSLKIGLLSCNKKCQTKYLTKTCSISSICTHPWKEFFTNDLTSFHLPVENNF